MSLSLSRKWTSGLRMSMHYDAFNIPPPSPTPLIMTEPLVHLRITFNSHYTLIGIIVLLIGYYIHTRKVRRNFRVNFEGRTMREREREKERR